MSDYDDWKTTEPDDVLPRADENDSDDDETVEKIVDLFAALKKALQPPQKSPPGER